MATLQSIPSQPTSLVSNPPDNPDRITLDHCLAISFVSSLLATAIISTTWEALKAAYTACRGWIPELKFFDKRNGTEEDNGEERELAMRVREKGESGGRDETERKDEGNAEDDADKDDDEQRDSETSAGWDPPIGLISMLIEFLGRAAGWDGAAGEDADSRKDVVEKQEGATKDKEDDITSDTGRKRKRSG